MKVRFDRPYPVSGSITLHAQSFNAEAITAWELALNNSAMNITLPDDLASGEYAVELKAVWTEPAANTATYHLGVKIE